LARPRAAEQPPQKPHRGAARCPDGGPAARGADDGAAYGAAGRSDAGAHGRAARNLPRAPLTRSGSRRFSRFPAFGNVVFRDVAADGLEVRIRIEHGLWA